jgi:hypothetical protein
LWRFTPQTPAEATDADNDVYAEVIDEGEEDSSQVVDEETVSVDDDISHSE